jgi:hypothetical protein
LEAVYNISQAWPSMNPVTLFRTWKKLLPGVEDDMQGFPNEETSSSEILDLVCSVRSFGNMDKDNIEK